MPWYTRPAGKLKEKGVETLGTDELLAIILWGKSNYNFGNINEKKFSEIWESERIKSFRKVLKEKKCSDCLLSCYM